MILGAFGCGAFENNPEVVAMAAKNVLKDYLPRLLQSGICRILHPAGRKQLPGILSGCCVGIAKHRKAGGELGHGNLRKDFTGQHYREFTAPMRPIRFCSLSTGSAMSPNVNQARRFLIELMQNARDLAYKKPDGTPEPVSIRIRLSDTELEFSHNGKVFSVKAHSFYHLSGILKEAG